MSAERAYVPRFAIGDPVEIAPSYRFSGDWIGIELWVCGVQLPAGRDYLEYAVTEEWPTFGPGNVTDEFREEHLCPRAGNQPKSSTPTVQTEGG